MDNTNVDFIQGKVNKIKKECLDMCIKAGKGHLTSAFSCAEIAAVLYYSVMNYDVKNPDWEDRDRFIMSKNHGSVITYPILADLNFIQKDELSTFMQGGSRLGSHSNKDIPGVEFSGGSLGIGFGIAAGLAYAAKMDKKEWFTFAILGDGECYEGSVWETAMFAAHNQLNNLIAIVDRNGLSILGFTEDLLRLEPLGEKWNAFGWDVLRVNGHDISSLLEVFGNAKSRKSSRPLCIIADTIKGKGIDFMVNQPFMHGAAPTGDKVPLAYSQLETDAKKGVAIHE
jgi:transketolase